MSTVHRIKKLFEFESASGIFLIIAALIAIIIANSPLANAYHHFLHDTDVTIGVGAIRLDKSLLHFINDGLMAIFFLLVGLEIKREVMEGQLSSKEQLYIPLIGAVGGIVVPALIFSYINSGTPTIKGWAIPTATDIAFALGILSLFGSRVPVSLKIFLTALAIIDDLAAIIIIAVFYSSKLSIVALLLSTIAIIALFALNFFNVRQKSAYVIFGVLLWSFVLQSGVHATLAGVVLGLFIPLRVKTESGYSVLRSMEHDLAPWVGFLILPLFAFANAGVTIGGLSLNILFDPLTLGIILGLFVGKQLGVFSFIFLLIKTGIAKMPDKATWLQIYGVSILTGIGFTMSLFIGNLSFPENGNYLAEVRVGVLVASLLSTIVGYCVLSVAIKRANR